jgi:hypothetical protein
MDETTIDRNAMGRLGKALSCGTDYPTTIALKGHQECPHVVPATVARGREAASTPTSGYRVTFTVAKWEMGRPVPMNSVGNRVAEVMQIRAF